MNHFSDGDFMDKMRLLALIAIVILFFVPSIASGKVVGWLSDAKGSVSVERAGKILDTEIGIKLHEKDIVITGAKSNARIKMQGGDYISLGYRSRIVIDEYRLNKKKEIVSAGFKALFGKFMFAVGKLRNNDAYRINTQTAVLGVRGTKWYTQVESAKTEVAGLEGLVSVTAAGQTKVVGAGESVVATLAGVGAVIATPAILIHLFMQEGLSASLTGATAGGGSAAATVGGTTTAATGISTTALLGGAVAIGGVAAVASGGGSSKAGACAGSYAGTWSGTSSGTNCEADGGEPFSDLISLVVRDNCTWEESNPNSGDPSTGSVDPNTGAVTGTATETGSACNPSTITGTLNGSAFGSTGSGTWSDAGGGTGTWQLTKQGATPSPDPQPPTNTPPVAVDDSASTLKDTPVTIDVLANDSDADGDPLALSSADLISVEGGSVIMNNDNTMTYTPPSGFAGSDSFDYSIDDGHGGADSAMVAVTVTTPATLNDFSPNVGPPSYTCGGSCQITGANGIASTNVTVSGNQVILSSFHAPLNGSPIFINSVPGSNTASSQSNNLSVLGAPGHSCSLNRVSDSLISVSCQNNQGGFCSDSCSH